MARPGSGTGWPASPSCPPPSTSRRPGTPRLSGYTARSAGPSRPPRVLRQQSGFGGFVPSDWFATHSTAASANAGLDQDMPGSDGYFGSALQSAVSSGAVSTATLNSMVTPVLTEMFAFGLFDEPP